jgi:hypothetical protein
MQSKVCEGGMTNQRKWAEGSRIWGRVECDPSGWWRSAGRTEVASSWPIRLEMPGGLDSLGYSTTRGDGDATDDGAIRRVVRVNFGFCAVLG